MKYQFDNFIGLFEDVVNPEFCDLMINFFDNTESLGIAKTRQESEQSHSTKLKKDDLTVFHNFTIPQEILFSTYPHLPELLEAVNHCYNLYKQEYDVFEHLANTANTPGIRIQKTKPGQGYHVWHCEHCNVGCGSRVLAWTLYLNDVKEGGETEFLYQKRRIYPKKGSIILWPSGFTHTHRGNPPLSGDKYIATSWIQFIE
jgi:hypothetical protein